MFRGALVRYGGVSFVLLIFQMSLNSCIKRNQNEHKSYSSDLKLTKSSKSEKVLLVTAEQTGVFNTGGLGHTVSSLAGALQQFGYQTEVIMPYYQDISSAVRESIVDENEQIVIRFPNHSKLGLAVARDYVFTLHSVINPINQVKTWLLQHQSPGRTALGLFDNIPLPGQAKRYTNSPSEATSFLAFNKAVAEFILKRDHTLINIHDWHAATVRMGLRGRDFLKSLNEKKFLFTISNMGYQGIFDADLAFSAGLSEREFLEKAEFYGSFNSLKYAMETSDFVLTVAPGYLKEIATKRYGGGLENLVLRLGSEYKISAILNGTDVEMWDPVKRYHKDITHTFTPKDFSGKARGKAKLQKQLDFTVSEKIPLIALTSRVADQKGYAYLTGALNDLASMVNDVQIVILGDGEDRYLSEVRDLAQSHPRKLRYLAFDSDFEKPLTAYSDFFVNVPWYEPSGTNQLFAMKNGTIPIVTRVGGLADFVQDGKTGFLFDLILKDGGVETDIDKSRDAVVKGVLRALAFFRDDPRAFNKMRMAAMAQDNSWSLRMPVYERLFQFIRKGGPSHHLSHCAAGKMLFQKSTSTTIELMLHHFEQFCAEPVGL